MAFAGRIPFILAIPVGFVGFMLGDLVRRITIPDIIFTTGGMLAILKERIFWFCAPQLIGIIIGVSLGAALVLPSYDKMPKGTSVSQSPQGATVSAQAAPSTGTVTPKHQYRQMGSIAALAEACYGSKAIPEKLNAQIKRAVSENPAVRPTTDMLVAEYNQALTLALANHRVWNTQTQSFSQKSFACGTAGDVAAIREFEATILKEFK